MKTCFLSIDVESSDARSDRAMEDKKKFEGVERMDRMLDAFKKHNANATLFVTGEVLEKYPDLVKEWAKDFEIGCHNYYHKTLDTLDLKQREKQIKDFMELYQKIFKIIPKGFRAPRNVIDDDQFPILKKHGFLYDASVFPRYPWWKKRYAGYKGKKSVVPYYLKNELIELPESPAPFSIPLVGTWVRGLGMIFYRLLFLLRKPKFVSFNMHSWDSLEENYIKQLDQMLRFLKKSYSFKSGEEIYEEFSKNK